LREKERESFGWTEKEGNLREKMRNNRLTWFKTFDFCFAKRGKKKTFFKD
jgi:hypothetical protein